jgi:protein subunit release factor A
MVGYIEFTSWPERTTGGQVVGVGSTGVKGIHYFDDGFPSGIEACCSLHRSQFKNKNTVVEMIEWALGSL